MRVYVLETNIGTTQQKDALTFVHREHLQITQLGIVFKFAPQVILGKLLITLAKELVQQVITQKIGLEYAGLNV